MSRGRALRTGVAFDMRDGMKTRGRRLVQDGEMPGVWTSKGNADPQHPSKYLRIPPPDGLNYRPGPPAMHSIGVKVDLAWSMQSDTHVAGSDTQQPFTVLARASFRPISISIIGDALDIGDAEYLPEGALLWGGFELQWGGVDLAWGNA